MEDKLHLTRFDLDESVFSDMSLGDITTIFDDDKVVVTIESIGVLTGKYRFSVFTNVGSKRKH